MDDLHKNVLAYLKSRYPASVAENHRPYENHLYIKKFEMLPDLPDTPTYYAYIIPIYSLVVLYNHIDKISNRTVWGDCLMPDISKVVYTMICTLMDDIGTTVEWNSIDPKDVGVPVVRPAPITLEQLVGDGPLTAEKRYQIRLTVAQHLQQLSKYVAYRLTMPDKIATDQVSR